MIRFIRFFILFLITRFLFFSVVDALTTVTDWGSMTPEEKTNRVKTIRKERQRDDEIAAERLEMMENEAEEKEEDSSFPVTTRSKRKRK